MQKKKKKDCQQWPEGSLICEHAGQLPPFPPSYSPLILWQWSQAGFMVWRSGTDLEDHIAWVNLRF